VQLELIDVGLGAAAILVVESPGNLRLALYQIGTSVPLDGVGLGFEQLG